MPSPLGDRQDSGETEILDYGVIRLCVVSLFGVFAFGSPSNHD
jgi:hypothetical protein